MKQARTAMKEQRAASTAPPAQSGGPAELGSYAEQGAFEELDLGSETLTLDAATDLQEAIDAAQPSDPWDEEADWAGATAERWRRAAFDLADAHAQHDAQSRPTTPFGIQQEQAALSGMKSALDHVESTSMGLETLRMTLHAGGAALRGVDLTTQVAIGVLERRGDAEPGSSEDSVVVGGAPAGKASEAGAGWAKVPGAVARVGTAQRNVSATWGAMRARAIEASVGPERERMADIEQALAFIDATISGLVSSGSEIFNMSPARAGAGVSAGMDLLARDEMDRLQARIDAAMGHAGAVRSAAEREAFVAALESLGAAVSRLRVQLTDVMPDVERSSGDMQSGTSMADALLAQQAAVVIVDRAVGLGVEVGGRMDRAMGHSLHEPARSVVSGERGLAGDRTRLETLQERLVKRKRLHQGQIDALKGT